MCETERCFPEEEEEEEEREEETFRATQGNGVHPRGAAKCFSLLLTSEDSDQASASLLHSSDDIPSKWLQYGTIRSNKDKLSEGIGFLKMLHMSLELRFICGLWGGITPQQNKRCSFLISNPLFT